MCAHINNNGQKVIFTRFALDAWRRSFELEVWSLFLVSSCCFSSSDDNLRLDDLK